MTNEISHDELLKLFKYSPETGEFTRIMKTTYCTNVNEIAGCLDSNGYVVIRINNKNYYAHRLIWLYVYGEFPVNQIDHKNGTRNDNRILNLREATSAENNRNRKLHSNNKSGYRGVSWSRQRGMWKSQCKFNNKTLTLGFFHDAKLASDCYLEFIKKHYGDFYMKDNNE